MSAGSISPEHVQALVEQFRIKERRLEAKLAALNTTVSQKDEEIARLRSQLDNGTGATMNPPFTGTSTAKSKPLGDEHRPADSLSEEMMHRHRRLGLYGTYSFALNILLLHLLLALKDAGMLTPAANANGNNKSDGDGADGEAAAAWRVQRWILNRVEGDVCEKRAYAILRGWETAMEPVDRRGRGLGRGQTETDDTARAVHREDATVLEGLMGELLGLSGDRELAAQSEDEETGTSHVGKTPFVANFILDTLAAIDFHELQRLASSTFSSTSTSVPSPSNNLSSTSHHEPTPAPTSTAILTTPSTPASDRIAVYVRDLADPHNASARAQHRGAVLAELLDVLPHLEAELADWGVNGPWILRERRRLAREAEAKEAVMTGGFAPPAAAASAPAAVVGQGL